MRWKFAAMVVIVMGLMLPVQASTMDGDASSVTHDPIVEFEEATADWTEWDWHWWQVWIDSPEGYAEAWFTWIEAMTAPTVGATTCQAHVPTNSCMVQGIEVCNGGTLPPCWRVDNESRYVADVWNTGGSGAHGLYQFMPGTWNGHGGYSSAGYAPVSVQVEKARLVWDGGAGCFHWSAC